MICTANRQAHKVRCHETEDFDHDALNRVTASRLNTVTTLSVGYDQAGNITSKSDVGAYDYTTSRQGDPLLRPRGHDFLKWLFHKAT
jgi:YD repeat-containing protein